MKSHVAQLAEQFGQGQVNAAAVVAALALHPRPTNSGDLLTQDVLGEDPSDDYPEMPNGWDDVETVYYSGGLTEAQFAQLYLTAFS